jgi:hypothetical protein
MPAHTAPFLRASALLCTAGNCAPLSCALLGPGLAGVADRRAHVKKDVHTSELLVFGYQVTDGRVEGWAGSCPAPTCSCCPSPRRPAACPCTALLLASLPVAFVQVDRAPHLVYGVADAAGHLVHGPVPIFLPEPVMMHDFAVTQHYS